MAEVIKRIKTDNLTTEEYKFVSDMPLYEAFYGDLVQKLEQKDQIINEKDQIIDDLKGKHLEIINNLWKRGNDIISIADVMGLSVKEVKAIIQKMQ
jgi:predicted transposase YdaD